MALSKDLEEELTCPIDLEYYEDPMLLKCLHILCKKDVDQMLNEDELLQCPVCKRISEKRDIKNDFRTKRLIELVKGDADKLKEHQICEFCDEEAALSWCQDCKMYLGKQCEKAHKRTPVTKEHHLDYIADIISNGKERIQRYMFEIKTQASEYELDKEKWAKAKEEAITPEIFDKIQESEDAIIAETKRVHNELRKQLRTKLEKNTNHLDTQIANLNSKLELFSRKMQILRDIIETDDNKTLLNREFINELIDQSLISHDKSVSDEILPTTTENINISLSSREQVIKELRQLQLITNEEDKNESHSMHTDSLVQGVGAIPKKHTALNQSQIPNITCANESTSIVTRSTNIPKPYVQTPGNNFTNFLNKPLHAQVICKFEEYPRAISIIGNNIWIIFSSGRIGIYQENPKHKVNSINSIVIHEKVNTTHNKPKLIQYVAERVIDFNDGTLITSCSGPLFSSDCDNEENGEDTQHKNLGLVTIDDDGLIQYIISQGRYWDVSNDGEYVYGLKAGSALNICKKNEQGWCKVKSISLEFSVYHLCVANAKIIFSRFSTDTVTSFNLESNTQQQLTSTGQDVGQVDHPQVSCSDQDGNVLICEKNNHRIQVLLANNTWKVMSVNGELRYPRDSAISNDGRLYVISQTGTMYILE